MKYRQTRHPSNFDVNLNSRSTRAMVKLADVNTSGARLLGTTELQPGEMVTISYMNSAVSGVVRWTASGRAGIAFRPHITQQQVDQITACIRTRMVHQPRFDSSVLQEMR